MLVTSVVALPGAAVETTTGSTVSGTVTNGDGAAIDGICVNARREDVNNSEWGLSTRTASDGTWEITGLNSGYYSLQFFDCDVVPPSYQYATWGDEQAWATNANARLTLVELGQDMSVAGLDQVMRAQQGNAAGSSIAGTISLPAAHGLTQVCVTLVQIAGNFSGPAYRQYISVDATSTEATYAFAVPASADQQSVLEVGDCEMRTHRVLYAAGATGNATTDYAAATKIVHTGSPQALDLTLGVGAVQRVKVQDQNGQPVAGICVQLTPLPYRSWYHSDAIWTDASGFADVVAIQGENLARLSSCQGDRSYRSKFVYGLTVPSASMSFTVEKGAPVSGDITFASGVEPGNVCVSLFGHPHGVDASAHGFGQDSYGHGGQFRYVTDPLPVGTFDFMAHPCSFRLQAPATGQVVLTDDDEDGVPEAATKDVEMQKGAGVRFLSASDRGCMRAVESARAGDLEPPSPFGAQRYLLHTGKIIVIGLAATTYDIDLFDCSDYDLRETFTGVTLTAGEVFDLDTLEGTTPGASTGRISGRVTRSGDGAAIRNATVEACRAGARCVFTRTNAAGEYSLSSLDNGSWTVKVHVPGAGTVTSEPVTVAGAAVVVDLVVSAPTGSVSGSIVDESASPIEGAWIGLCTPDGPCFGQSVGSDGTYAFDGVPDGTSWIYGYADGYENGNAAVSVTAGGATNAGQLVLRRPKTVPAGFRQNTSGEGDVPRTRPGEPNKVTAPAECPDPLTFQVLQNDVAREFIQGGVRVTTGQFTKDAVTGEYATEFEVDFAGPATVKVDGDGDDCDVEWSMYIDPSGNVYDQNGAPVAGATVTLLRSDVASGGFEPVPNGSTVMSSSNRVNPSTTDAAGHFGWDVTPGFYQVTASKSGCTDPVNGDDTVESAVYEIPPPVTDVVLVLHCPQLRDAGGNESSARHGNGSPTAQDPVHVTVTSPNGSPTIKIVTGTAAVDGDRIRLSRSVEVTAPAATAVRPLTLQFVLDGSVAWSGANLNEFEVERNGAVVPACTTSDGTAAPDPCVSSRRMQGDDFVIEVLSSRASTWTFTTPAGACGDATLPYSDVAADGAHAEAISCLARLAVATGTSPDTYSPGLLVTRGQMAALVGRAIEAAGIVLPNGPDAFDDDNGTTHEAVINRLAAAGVVKGVDGRSFAPGASISRGQVASMLARAWKVMSGQDLVAGPDAFMDDDGTKHEAAINATANAGLFTGRNGRSDHTASTTRAQMASFIDRLLDKWSMRAAAGA